MTPDQMRRLRFRAHVHVGTSDGRPQPPGSCYGRYEPCGEHHVHDDRCGGRDLVCGHGHREDSDLAALLSSYDKLQSRLAAHEHLEEDWTFNRATGHTNSSSLYLEMAAIVEDIIRQSAHALIAGRAGSVARHILAHLAHKHGFRPKPIASQPAASGPAIRAAGAQAGVAARGHGRPASRDEIESESSGRGAGGNGGRIGDGT